MNLPGRYQAAKHFPHFAAGSERGQEEFDFFHAGGDDGLQIDRRKYRNCRDLRGGSTFCDGLLKALAQQLPLGGLSGRGNDRNDTELLPKFSDGAQNGGFGHFATQSKSQLGNGRVAGLQPLVGLNGERRDLAGTGKLRAATPIAVAAQRIHVGQNPACDHKVGLFAGLSQQIEPDSHTVIFKADQQLLGNSNLPRVGGCIPLACRSLNE